MGGLNFASFFGLEIIQGRDFTEADWKTDVAKTLINEEAARVMQLTDPIGQKIEIDLDYYTPEGPGRGTMEIIGVFRDFHGIGLKQPIMPMILKSVSSWRETIYYVRSTPGTETETLQSIRSILEEYIEESQVSKIPLITMTDLLNKLSQPEQDLLKLFLTVSLLCILIAVFGIYSVSQRETQRRRKEIAIRKTAGAKRAR